MKHKFGKGILAVQLILAMVLTGVFPVYAEETSVCITSREAFVAFAKNCTLDTWSQGKTVSLGCDLDFTGAEFVPVPSFGGTFYGNGHTISGIHFTGDGSYQGVFRYVQKGALVSDLHVEAFFAPGGSKNVVGGIAGENSGTLQNCSFSGTVKAESTVGGIAGSNTEYGQILSCVSSGSISGESFTGGIAGKNSGFLQDCSNHAAVNTVYEEKKTALSDLSIETDAAAVLETYQEQEEELEENSELGHSDTGGIAGYSSGIVQGCVNDAAVGYPHVGYNVGGIAGRQSGYMSGCQNSGLIQGRKDVGGIAGQAEPYIVLNRSESTLTEMQNELETLNAMVDTLLNSTGDLGNDVQQSLDAISAQSQIAQDNTQTLLNRGSDFVDNNLGALNTQAAVLSDTLNRLLPVFENLINSSENLEGAWDWTRELFDEVDIRAPHLQSELAPVKEALAGLSGAEELLNASITGAKSAFQELEQAILRLDFAAARNALTALKEAVQNLVKAKELFVKGMTDLDLALKALPKEVDSYINGVDVETDEAKRYLSDAITSLIHATDDITRALTEAEEAFADLSEETPLSFVALGDEFRTAGDDLFHSLSEISGGIAGLRNSVSGGTDRISENLDAISDQFQLIMNLFISEMEDAGEGVDSITELVQDVSDEDIEHTKQGKVEACRNLGRVEADRNTGGIAGAMAIEYAKDPEDEIEKPDTLKFTYQTRAILQSCINEGGVTGKKDCAGGIVGLSELGTVYTCENYGDVASSNGDYVGGVAGKSASSIRRSYGKGKLTGKRYVGGIAGKGTKLTDCCAIVNVSGDEDTGAICGAAEDREQLSQNFYTDNGLGAVGGISYAGKAEPVSFAALQQNPAVPARMLQFTVSFVADESCVATQEIAYGTACADIPYPEVPKKEGCFGVWESIEAETVTENLVVNCVYQPYITVLSSTERDASGKLALALAEGAFTDRAELHLRESAQKPPLAAGKQPKLYDVSLSGTELQSDDVLTLRVLNAEKDRVTAWCLKDTGWEQLDVAERGKYVTLQLNGTENTICLQYQKNRLPLVAALTAALAVLALGAFGLKRRKQKKKP